MVASAVQAAGRLGVLKSCSALIQATLGLMGIRCSDLSGLIAELRQGALVRAGLTEADILSGIQARADARKAKDYDQADAIRKEFVDKGIGFLDSPQGTTWRPVLAAKE